MDSQQMKSIEEVYKKWESRTAGGPRTNEQHVSNPGKKAWEDRFGDRIPATKRERASYRTKKRKPNKQVDFSFQPLSETKFCVPPVVIPAMFKRRRPVMGDACSRCCMKSKKSYEGLVPSWGMRNILSMEIYKKQNLIKRSFCHIVYAWECNANCYQYPDVTKSVLQSERVKNHILTYFWQEPAHHSMTAQEIKRADKERKKKVARLQKETANILSTMAATISRTFVRLSAWFLMKLCGKLLSSIQIHRGQMDMLREAAQDEKPMLFLPLHKSHLDYILITFVLVCCDMKVPLVAAGENLRIPIFGYILRHLGGFFIKRKLDYSSGKDDLYKSVLQEYVEQLLQNGHYMEFYIEGSRSRSGKAMVPKSGLLSLVVNSVMEGLVPDVNIVPVNISYEKVVDSGYTKELLGEKKTPESFWRTLKSIWRVLRSKYGNVRLDFGQPFSLQEFSQCMSVSQAMKEFATQVLAKSSVNSLPRSSLLRNSSDLSLADTGDDQCFTLTKALGYHVIHDAVKCCAIMSTNMVAFLLLHNHRMGATFDDLISSFEWLHEQIISRGRDVGFSGKTPAVIRHALRLIADDVTVTEGQKDPEGGEKIHIKPKLVLPHALNLTYYSNQVVPLFAMEAVLACGIVSAAEESESYDTNDIEEQTIVSQSLIIEKAKDLCDILQRELILAPPCVTLEAALIEGLDTFTASEILKTTEKSASSGRSAGGSFGWDEEDEDDDFYDVPDIEYKLTSNTERLQRLRFLQSVIGPLVESYWVSACGLLWLKTQSFTESEFLNALLSCAKERVKEEVTLFPESCSLEAFRNAMRIFREWNVLQLDSDGSVKLCQEYNDEDALFELIERINQFRI